MFLWIKALHVLAIISWMAGMLYLPRLFVRHADTSTSSEASELFKVMEVKLLRIIMNPAMIVAWISGLWLAWDAAFFSSGWLHGKLFLVILLTATHGFLAVERKKLEQDIRVRTSKFFRVLNEVPTLLMIGIVILVIVKPF